MTAVLPSLFANGHEPSELELRQLWNASRILSNIVGYTSPGGVTLAGGTATTNTLFGSVSTLTKLGSADESFLIGFVSVTFFWPSGTPNVATFGIGIGTGNGGNTDADIVTFGGNINNHHDPVMGFAEIAGIDAGQYNCCLYYRLSGGAITINSGDSVMMTVLEVPYGA